jgi:hypothetical protein
MGIAVKNFNRNHVVNVFWSPQLRLIIEDEEHVDVRETAFLKLDNPNFRHRHPQHSFL